MAYLKSRGVAQRIIVVAVLALVAVSVIAVAAVINPKRALAATATCARTGTIDVAGKTYEAQNNLWNAAATGQQCINVDTSTGTFSVPAANNSVPTNGAPASYPSIYKGCHWGNCTVNSGLPLQVSTIASVNSSWNISTVSGAWDSSYDIWFNQTPTTTGQPNGTEVMVWINHSGAPQPFGAQTGTVSINGSSWNVWTGVENGGGTSWNIISYVDVTPTTSVNFDLKNFFTDAVARGSIHTDWYLIDVEAGFELWQGSAGMTSNAFAVTPVAGSGGGGATPTPPPNTPTPTPRPGNPTPTPVSGSNGVTASGVVASSSPYYSEEDVKFSNTAPITAMSITVTVQKTGGASYNGAYTTFGGVTATHADNGSTLTYTYTLNAGQTIAPSSNLLAAAQFNGNGTTHATSGDTWTITTTSGGKINTTSGHF